MPKLIDPRKALQAAREAASEPSAAEIAGARKKTARSPTGARPHGPAQASPQTPQASPEAAEDAYLRAVKSDFRVFLTLVWRHLLNTDPNPIQIDMAHWLQNGPDRAIIMAFRGFSKSWITAAYALWRLLRDPDEKILVISGSLGRSVATTNMCLQLILEMPILQHLTPKPNQRQSSKMFDVGPASISQSASFMALGIGGQIVGFRGTCIIPDDVETQTNSRTVAGRELISEAVKEYDSVLVPPAKEEDRHEFYNMPAVKYLGTPHDEDSVYNRLGARGYTTRIWPGLFPTQEQIKKYGGKLAPWIEQRLRKDPGLVGRSTMPMRFPDSDLAKRLLSLGRSEFALQFMLDTSLSDRDKYPLKVKDLMVMSLDPRRGPEAVSWSGDAEHRDSSPSMGFEGDFWQKALYDPKGPTAPYTRIVGFVDPAGRGNDEVALSIVAELNGTLFWLHLWAAHGGYEVGNLRAIAAACVRYGVHELLVEDNFGDGMFAQLLRPHVEKAWAAKHALSRKEGKEAEGGTMVTDTKATNQMAKERRLLSVLEPACQSHRIVVDRKVIEWDAESLKAKEGEDTRHRFAWGYQFTHLTRERDCLYHDDRVDSFGGAVGAFAEVLGVDPGTMAQRASQDRNDEEWEKLFGPDDGDDEMGLPKMGRSDQRPAGVKPSAR